MTELIMYLFIILHCFLLNLLNGTCNSTVSVFLSSLWVGIQPFKFIVAARLGRLVTVPFTEEKCSGAQTLSKMKHVCTDYYFTTKPLMFSMGPR